MGLQILRFVAAMMVTGFHTRYLVPAVTGAPGYGQPGFLQIGDAGVDIFFVLSGFVIAMTGPLALRPPTALVFFWRRWRRVAPVYLILSAPMIYAAWRGGWMTGGVFASTFLFWPLAGGRPSMPALSLGWTLCFEMTFYTAMAALLIGGRPRRNLMIGVAAGASLIVINGLVWRTAAGEWLGNGLFLEFVIGCALAAVRERLARLGPALGALLAGLALTWFVTLGLFADLGPLDPRIGYLDGSISLLRVATFAAPATLIVVGAVAMEPWLKGPLARLLSAGGDASFSIYLTNLYAMHAIVGLWTWRHWPPNALVMGLLGVVLAWGGGFLVYRYIEKPVLRDLKTLSFAAPRAAPVK
jgi:exopolysaccharide production protein ExoZ